LDARLRTLLTVASVEGEEFTAEVVARVEAYDERQLVQRLGNELDRQHRLVRAQEVRHLGRSRLSRLYHTLTPAERTYLHEAVGVALEELYGIQEAARRLIAAQLARHFQEAGLTDKAIDYRLLAGQQAVQIAANQEAITHYQAGLALLSTLPNTPEHAQRELTLQIALGVPVTALRGYAHPDVEPIYTRAATLSAQLGETAQRFPALYGLWRMYVSRGALSAGEAIGNQLMALAQQTQDLDWLVEAYRAVGINAFHLGDLRRARQLLAQGLQLYDRQRHGGHAFLYGHDPAVSCLGYLAHTLWLLGYPDQALARVQEVLQLADELDHPFSRGHALTIDAGILYQLCREVAATQAVAQQGVALANEHRFPLWQAVGNILSGWTVAAEGQNTAGLTAMQEGLAHLSTIGVSFFVPYFLGVLAETAGQGGQIATGLTHISEAMGMIGRTSERWYEAELHRVHGELLLAAGAPVAEVETHLQQSLVLAQQQAAKSLELRTTMSLCRLWQRQGWYSEAHALLAAIYGWFTEGFTTRDLLEARSLLMALTNQMTTG
jgi:predicted ATPase